MQPVWSNIGLISSWFLNRSQTKYETADIERASRAAGRDRTISFYGRQGEGSFIIITYCFFMYAFFFLY